MKKLTSLAVIALCMAASALPAAAANTVTIKWNVTAIASVTFQGNYTNTGTSGSLNPTAATLIGPIETGSTGSCGAGGTNGAGGGTNALTLDFGAISPDSSTATFCMLLNGAEAVVNTNDTNGVTVAVQQTTAPAQAGAAICYVPISGNAPIAGGSTVSSSTLTAAKATDTTDATAGNWSDTTSACNGLKYSGVAITGAAAFGASTNLLKTSDNTTNPAYFGADLGVMMPANASKTAGDSAVVTYTVTTN
ncbi:MAG TPA: hypothetical protein VGZ02_15260 [Candidatus Baltobacteraceae bacterium]|nr:hypothetical protein [Candidatus Baltobacteraceae bacterium]